MAKEVTQSEVKVLFIVVCADLHAATGPFPTIEIAVEYAHKMNAKAIGCKFVPVEFHVLFMRADETSPETKKDQRGYL